MISEPIPPLVPSSRFSERPDHRRDRQAGLLASTRSAAARKRKPPSAALRSRSAAIVAGDVRSRRAIGSRRCSIHQHHQRWRRRSRGRQPRSFWLEASKLQSQPGRALVSQCGAASGGARNVRLPIGRQALLSDCVANRWPNLCSSSRSST